VGADHGALIREAWNLISRRNQHMSNFIEGGALWGTDTRLIYRNYATLYFIFIVDSSESELGILDLIQTFVETLDKCFKNVCELDLVFHADKVRRLLIKSNQKLDLLHTRRACYRRNGVRNKNIRSYGSTSVAKKSRSSRKPSRKC
jgi:hypothetical protein